MFKITTLQEADELCRRSGEYKKLPFANKQQIRSLIENADINISTANLVASSIGESDPRWMKVYTDYYEALRILVEALLQFDKLKIDNHQCQFACLCKTYPQLQFDWNFLEEIRFKRNRAHYYGEKISHEDWEKAKLRFNLYVTALKKEIEKRLKFST